MLTWICVEVHEYCNGVYWRVLIKDTSTGWILGDFQYVVANTIQNDIQVTKILLQLLLSQTLDLLDYPSTAS